jgi:hypothetical protein
VVAARLGPDERWLRERLPRLDGLYALFVFCSMYWLETTLAVSFRYRNEPMAQARVEPGDASGDPGRTAHDIANPVR